MPGTARQETSPGPVLGKLTGWSGREEGGEKPYKCDQVAALGVMPRAWWPRGERGAACSQGLAGQRRLPRSQQGRVAPPCSWFKKTNSNQTLPESAQTKSQISRHHWPTSQRKPWLLVFHKRWQKTVMLMYTCTYSVLSKAQMGAKQTQLLPPWFLSSSHSITHTRTHFGAQGARSAGAVPAWRTFMSRLLLSRLVLRAPGWAHTTAHMCSC